MINSWKYFDKREEIGELYIANGQYMAGHVIGIVLIEKNEDYSENSIRNAKKYKYPVRYEVVNSCKNDDEFAEKVLEKIRKLSEQGCRGIILASEEFCRIYHKILKNTELITLVSILQIIPFAINCVNKNKKVCIVCNNLKEDIISDMEKMGFAEYMEKCIITDSKLKKIIDINEIGCIIWDEDKFDDLDNCKTLFLDKNIPIYTYIKVAELLKMGLVQIPYEGWI